MENRTVREAITDGRWITDIAYNLNHDLLHEFFKLWRAIEGVGINLEDTREDTITWLLESSGEYSARSAYAVQFAGQIQSNHPALLWRAWAPPKVQILHLASSVEQAVDGSSATTA